MLPTSLPAARAAPPLTIVSSSNPGVFQDFSATTQFTAYTAPGGVPSGAQLSVVNNVLALKNAYAGSFSVDTKTAPFDAMKLGHLFFDYKLTPKVKVNLFFRVNGIYHAAVFSGPKTVRPGGVLMGNIEDVKSDGKWHRAHVPIRDWLRKIYPLQPALQVEEIIIGNWDNSSYLMAGFGGNGAGAIWNLDNWAIVGDEGAAPKFTVGGAPDGSTYVLDKAEPAPLDGTVSLQTTSGFHVLRVRDKAGKDLAVYPFYAASGAPVIGDAKWENNVLAIPIKAPGGLDLGDLSLEIGGRKFDRTSPQLRWDGATLRLDAAAAGLSWKSGERARVTLSGIKNLAGGEAVTKTGDAAIDFARLLDKPRAPRLRLSSAVQFNDGDFESGLDGWSSRDEGGAAIVERDDTAAVSGKYSVRLTCPANAVPFRAWIRKDGLDAALTPIMTFNYKVPANLRVDFLLQYAGTTFGLQFTDKDNPARRLGTVPEIIADNQWHRATVDLRALLRVVAPGQTSYKIDSLGLGDSGWLGNSRGTQFWFDDFYFAPAAPAGSTAELKLDDISGLKNVSWTLSDDANQLSATEPNAAGNTIPLAGNGLRWISARAQNGAGKWSDAAYLPVVVDTP